MTNTAERKNAYELANELVTSGEYHQVSVIEELDTGNVVAFETQRTETDEWQTLFV